jgi:aldose 1-epimerase
MGEIRSGRLSLGLAPEIGGSVAFFRRDGVDLMRPLSDADRAARRVVGAAMFPMAP